MGEKLFSVVFGWFILPLVVLFGGLFIFAEYAESHEWYEVVGVVLTIGGIAIATGFLYLYGKVGTKTKIYTRPHTDQRTFAIPKISTAVRSVPTEQVILIDHSSGKRSVVTAPPRQRHRFTTRANLEHRKT